MKRWFKFFGVFLTVLFVSLTLLILGTANKPYSEAERDAVARAESEGFLSSVEEAYVYASNEQMVTVVGTDAQGIRKAVFFREEGEPAVVELKGTVTKEQAEKASLADQEAEEVLHTKLGLEDGGPVWEVAFLNKKGQLSYVYISAIDGTWRKRILNL